MFNYVTKDQMVEFFESMSSAGFEMNVSNPTNLSLSEEVELMVLYSTELTTKII